MYSWKNYDEKIKKSPGIVDVFGSEANVILVDPKLIGLFLNNPSNYVKTEFLMDAMKQILGAGIFFQEGETWKNNRKKLSKLFNFDLIKDNAAGFKNIS